MSPTLTAYLLAHPKGNDRRLDPRTLTRHARKYPRRVDAGWAVR